MNSTEPAPTPDAVLSPSASTTQPEPQQPTEPEQESQPNPQPQPEPDVTTSTVTITVATYGDASAYVSGEAKVQNSVSTSATGFSARSDSTPNASSNCSVHAQVSVNTSSPNVRRLGRRVRVSSRLITNDDIL